MTEDEVEAAARGMADHLWGEGTFDRHKTEGRWSNVESYMNLARAALAAAEKVRAAASEKPQEVAHDITHRLWFDIRPDTLTPDQWERLTRAVEDAVRAAADGWRPIESAPHGEDVFLGWWQDNGLGGRDWMQEVGLASWGWRRGSISNISRHGSATHWMPLPPPPEDKP